jgi:hypothetical protein
LISQALPPKKSTVGALAIFAGYSKPRKVTLSIVSETILRPTAAFQSGSGAEGSGRGRIAFAEMGGGNSGVGVCPSVGPSASRSAIKPAAGITRSTLRRPA